MYVFLITHTQLEKQKEMLQNGNTAKAEKYNWDKALAKAQGQKIKDDPALLKKSIKRDEYKKKKSKKAW